MLDYITTVFHHSLGQHMECPIWEPQELPLHHPQSLLVLWRLKGCQLITRERGRRQALSCMGSVLDDSRWRTVSRLPDLIISYHICWKAMWLDVENDGHAVVAKNRKCAERARRCLSGCCSRLLKELHKSTAWKAILRFIPRGSAGLVMIAEKEQLEHVSTHERG